MLGEALAAAGVTTGDDAGTGAATLDAEAGAGFGAVTSDATIPAGADDGSSSGANRFTAQGSSPASEAPTAPLDVVVYVGALPP